MTNMPIATPFALDDFSDKEVAEHLFTPNTEDDTPRPLFPKRSRRTRRTPKRHAWRKDYRKGKFSIELAKDKPLDTPPARNHKQVVRAELAAYDAEVEADAADAWWDDVGAYYDYDDPYGGTMDPAEDWDDPLDDPYLYDDPMMDDGYPWDDFFPLD